MLSDYSSYRRVFFSEVLLCKQKRSLNGKEISFSHPLAKPPLSKGEDRVGVLT